MNRSTFLDDQVYEWVRFSKARYMNGVGFEILARTPVPKLPLSYHPPPPPSSPRVFSRQNDLSICSVAAVFTGGSIIRCDSVHEPANLSLRYGVCIAWKGTCPIKGQPLFSDKLTTDAAPCKKGLRSYANAYRSACATAPSNRVFLFADKFSSIQKSSNLIVLRGRKG